MPKRDPEQTYSYGGQLYGKNGRDLAELEKKSPLKGEDGVGEREYSGTEHEQNAPVNRNPATTEGTEVKTQKGDKDGNGRLQSGEYAGADAIALMTEIRARGLEAAPGSKKGDLVKILEAHDEEQVNPAKF